MKKILALLIFLLVAGYSIFTAINREVHQYTLEIPVDQTYSQYNEFNPYDIKAYDFDKNDLIDNVKIYGLELLGLEDNRITEFGSFNIRYTIEVDDVVVCHAYREIKVIYQREYYGGLLCNGDFYAGLNEWGVVDWKNNLDISVSNNQLIINQKSVDEYVWDQSIYQYTNSIEIGKKYKLSFDAKSTNSKTIKVCLAQTFPVSPWSYNLHNEFDVEIDNELKTYSFDIETSMPNNLENGLDLDLSQVRLEFKFGKYNDLNNIKSTIIFDNIKLVEIK